jgi:hypothetical protein
MQPSAGSRTAARCSGATQSEAVGADCLALWARNDQGPASIGSALVRVAILSSQRHDDVGEMGMRFWPARAEPEMR